jgi:hypothetical protein
MHEFTRSAAGEISIVQSIPSDVATPRTIRDITRGGSETPSTKPKPTAAD